MESKTETFNNSTILVLQPDRQCGPDRLANWSKERGVKLDVRNPDTPSEMPASLETFDGLIVLGGEMGDGDTSKHPWLEQVRDTLREAHAVGLPTLGICLGGQLLASALGGTVEPGDAGLEAGAIPITPLEDATNDPLMQGMPGTFYSGSFHNDAISRLPPDAVLLATGERYSNQAFRCGSSWGVQFHPELNPAHYAEWVPLELESHPELEATICEFERMDSLVEDACGQLFHNFLDVVLDKSRVGRRAS
ncbi:type 1 glutamine amidotransferase [Leucobacter ruminantium]|uniref:Type 1 glutamine amidotransferase n=1 Tax=Leucobacter ruminantium TaxID=1289170 RepID=A0A939LXA5_9MICO|nr:type 1 glutamine amidotransferase [Leucobacter ruminantium]MBO1806410.1 type 1 glutamine amidotransferase [Leucobacter ruminantium]